MSEKSDSPSVGHDSHESKLLLGDNYGNIHLMDVSRKQILDKIEIERFKSRRIINISTCSIEWVDTRLTYAAVIARGNPNIEIVVFKHNENKLYNIYSLNVCPDLENCDNLEMNPKQTYLMLPSISKLSLDGEFLSITTYEGKVMIVKMPQIIDPTELEKGSTDNLTSPSN